MTKKYWLNRIKKKKKIKKPHHFKISLTNYQTKLHTTFWTQSITLKFCVWNYSTVQLNFCTVKYLCQQRIVTCVQTLCNDTSAFFIYKTEQNGLTFCCQSMAGLCTDTWAAGGRPVQLSLLLEESEETKWGISLHLHDKILKLCNSSDCQFFIHSHKYWKLKYLCCNANTTYLQYTQQRASASSRRRKT